MENISGEKSVERFESSPAEKQLLLIEKLIRNLSDEVCILYGEGDLYHLSRYNEYPLFDETEEQPELDEVIKALQALEEVDNNPSLSEDQKKEAMAPHFEVLKKHQV